MTPDTATTNSPPEDSSSAPRDSGTTAEVPPYLSLTDVDREQMLASLGRDQYDELEGDIPESLKREFEPVEPALSADEVLRWHTGVSQKNQTIDDLTCFLGGGLYDHFVPSTVMSLMEREEFLTSYTPYQAEMNQGTLQSMFEFQSMISELVDLPVTNASMYDGATAFAEAVLMAINATRRDVVYYSPNLFNQWIGVLKSYAKPHGWKLVELPTQNGRAHFPDTWDQDPAAVCMGYPNVYGCADAVTDWEQKKPDDTAVGICGVNPLAMGLLTPPGQLGWDVAVGEGQPLGLPLQGGAPQLGLFSAREDFMRKMPGRLVGQTEDRRGNRCYVLTLQTREQHIRRERATSNICTNHALLTIGVAVALATLGPEGLRDRARLNYQRGRALKRSLEAEGFEVLGDPVFNEITVKMDDADPQLNDRLAERGWIGGFWAENRYICAATERRSDEEIEQFAREVRTTLGS